MVHNQNIEGQPPAEFVEKRPKAEGNTGQATVIDTQGSKEASSALFRVREAAKRDSKLQFSNLLHHVTTDLLRESYLALNRQAATGIDGVTWREYGKELEERLPDLHDRVQSERYQAKPSKRIWIPKSDKQQRPIGIASLEDKIVQQALATILGQIYEVDFLDCSYGSRPGRSQHNALDAIYVAITQKNVNWILDADISKFYDSLDHEWMMKFVEHRVTDPRMLRLLRKFLRAGVSEDGEWSKTVVGTPQGAVMSSFLSNVYLHYVLDQWVEQWRGRHARGEVHIVRYVDDFVMGFQYRSDARRFQAELKQRLTKFSLEIHEGKTKLIEFGRFAIENRKEHGEGKPETFDFLGFTHICSKKKNGRFTIYRKTITKTAPGQNQKGPGNAASRKAPTRIGAGRLVKSGNAGALQLLRSPWQSKSTGHLPKTDSVKLVERSAQAESESPVSHMGAHEKADQNLVTDREGNTPVSGTTPLRLTRGRSRMR